MGDDRLGRRVSEDFALAHIRSVTYGGGGRWYLKPKSKLNQTMPKTIKKAKNR